MSSIISSKLLTINNKVIPTSITIAVANSESLPIRGATRLKFHLNSNDTIESTSNFIVANHQWDGFDGLLGNDILINLGAKVDMKNRILECEKGSVKMKLIKQTVKDLVMMPTKIDTHNDSNTEIECIAGQSIPAMSTKIIRFMGKVNQNNKCLLVPPLCLQESGCWSPECITQVHTNGECYIEVTNVTDNPILINNIKVEVEEIEIPDENILEAQPC